MKFLERNLEDIIFENGSEVLEERGLSVKIGRKYRQLRIGNYGVADIVYLHRDIDPEPCNEYRSVSETCSNCSSVKCQKTSSITITIMELKQNEINTKTFMQAIRYVKGIKRYLNKRGLFHRIPIHYRIILIGDRLGNDDSVYLTDILSTRDFFSVDFYTYSYDIDGIQFNCEYNYSLIDEGF